MTLWKIHWRRLRKFLPWLNVHWVNEDSIQGFLVWNLDPTEWVSTHPISAVNCGYEGPHMCNQIVVERYVLLFLTNLLALHHIGANLHLWISDLTNWRTQAAKSVLGCMKFSNSNVDGRDSTSGFCQQESFLPSCLVVEWFGRGEHNGRRMNVSTLLLFIIWIGEARCLNLHWGGRFHPASMNFI
jgi:hypothetical protein